MDSEDSSSNMTMEEEKEIIEEGSSFLTWLSNHKGIVVCIVIAIFIGIAFALPKKTVKDLRQRWFVSLIEFLRYLGGASKNKEVKKDEVKTDLFASLQSIVSHDPSLRRSGAIKILEIGVGTGTNFAYYPDETHLIVVDPNPHYNQHYDETRKKFPNIHAEDIIVATGEEMDMIPDNSVDAVVTTLVLCSVHDLRKVLEQILRVLTPGGKFYFYEHIHEFDTVNHSTRRKLQTFLTKSGIWPFFIDDCRLDTDMLGAIEAAGFSKVEADRFHAPGHYSIYQLIKPRLKGVAEK